MNERVKLGATPATPVTQRRALGATGLECSPLGFGTYRVARGVTTHQAALKAYLDSGGNLIDTSSNYALGQSELLIGDVLKDYPRDEVILVSKAGYIQGQNKITATQHGYPDIVKFAPDVWHCIHPQFLSDQLDMSCARMSVKRIDSYLLHNPEYFLKDKENRESLSDAAVEQFYAGIERAFRYFETEVEKGRLGSYGLSSNSLGLPANDPSFVSVARCLDIARSISSDHHLSTVQLPLNLFETGGAFELNNDNQTVLEFCRAQNIGVLVNRPLNALIGGQIVRLAETAGTAGNATDPEEALLFLRSHEESFKRLFDFPLLGGGRGVTGWFQPVVKAVPSMAEFHAAVRDSFTPAVNTWLLNADQTLKKEPGYREWRDAFGKGLDTLMEAMQELLTHKLAHTRDTVRSGLELAGLKLEKSTLSQASLAVIAGLEGVSCVLNGMRTPAYVADSLGALDVDDHDSLAVLRALNQTIELDPN